MFLSLPGSYRERSQAGQRGSRSEMCVVIPWGDISPTDPIIIDPSTSGRDIQVVLDLFFWVIFLFHTTVNHHQIPIWENSFQCVPSIENLRKIQVVRNYVVFLNDGYMMVIIPLSIIIIHCYMIGVHPKNLVTWENREQVPWVMVRVSPIL